MFVSQPGRQFVLLTLATLGMSGAIIHAEAPKPREPWSQFVDADGDCSFTQKDNGATIIVAKTHHDLTFTDAGPKLNAPRLLREVAGDFQLQATVQAFELPAGRLSSSGEFRFVSGGLIAWVNEKNFIRMDRAAEGDGPAPFLWVEHFAKGESISQQFVPLTNTPIRLRMTRRGDRLEFASSTDGKTWNVAYEADGDFPKKISVGLQSINTTDKQHTVEFDSVTVTQ